MTKKSKKVVNTTSKKKVTKSATKIKASKTKTACTEDVAKVLDIQGSVIVFPEKEVQTVLTRNEYEAILGTLGDVSAEDKAFYRRFKFSLDKNSKVLHAVSIEPCVNISQCFEEDDKHLTMIDVQSYMKIKCMSNEWLQRHMINEILIFETNTRNTWSNMKVKDGSVYHSFSFDMVFKSAQAARKYLKLLQSAYKVRTVTTS